MAFEKIIYVDNQTKITADQMNAIQDAIIENEEAIESIRGLIVDGNEVAY